MIKDYHFKVFGDDIELGILTNDEQAIEAFKRNHPDWVQFPVEINLPRRPAAQREPSLRTPRNGRGGHPPALNRPQTPFEAAVTRPLTPEQIRAMPSVKEVLAVRRAERDMVASQSMPIDGWPGRLVKATDATTGASHGALTNSLPLLDQAGRPVIGGNGQPVSRPENGHDLEFYIQQGKVAASVDLQYRMSYIVSQLSYFRRGGPWDEQRLDGRVDGRFVDYATIAIGAYAAAAGLAVRDILELEDFVARSSKFGNDTVFSLDFPHLPVRNVLNTETGYDLFNESRDVE